MTRLDLIITEINVTGRNWKLSQDKTEDCRQNLTGMWIQWPTKEQRKRLCCIKQMDVDFEDLRKAGMSMLIRGTGLDVYNINWRSRRWSNFMFIFTSYSRKVGRYIKVDFLLTQTAIHTGVSRNCCRTHCKGSAITVTIFKSLQIFRNV